MAGRDGQADRGGTYARGSLFLRMDALLRHLPTKPQPLVVRYGATVALVALFYVLVIGVQGEDRSVGFYFMFPAIFLASVLFDHGSGLLATLLSTGLLYFRLAPGREPPPSLAFHLVAFALIGVGLAIASEGLRLAWERALAAEREKDLLLRELGHRAMNNLAMVVSILAIQARLKTEPEVKAALAEAIARVQAIAAAHEHFRPTDSGEIEMRPYLEKLGDHLGDAFRGLRPIAVRVRVDDILLQAQQAISVGLIVNELVTNALKHAFPDDRGGAVTVALQHTPALSIVVEDNGVGLPAVRQDQMGSRLIRLLAEHLGGKLVFEDARPGHRVRVELPGSATIAAW